MPGDNKRLHILKQTSSWKLQVYCSVFELLLQTSMKRLNCQIITSSSVTTVKWVAGERFPGGFVTFGKSLYCIWWILNFEKLCHIFVAIGKWLETNYCRQDHHFRPKFITWLIIYEKSCNLFLKSRLLLSRWLIEQ